MNPLRFAPNQHIRHRRVEQNDQGDALEIGESFILTRMTPIEDVPIDQLPLVVTRPDMLVDQGDSRPYWEPSPIVACLIIVACFVMTGIVLIWLAYRFHHVHS